MTSKTALKISDDLSLPLETVTNTILMLARRRVGKTYTGAVMAEEMVKAGLPWVAMDPTGAWWGLTSSADGKREGLPVIVIGGPHAHIPLEPSAGKIIADMVVDNPGWYIIDFSRMDDEHDEMRVSTEFGKRLYRRKQRSPSAMHLFLDEADFFVPQKPPKNAMDMLRTYSIINRRGGIYGLGMTLISQRPALVNKDVTTQCETLIALQTSAPEDQDPILDWVSRNGTKEQLEEIKRTLASLKVGQAWYFSPNSDVLKLINIRTRETFNSSATPKPGAKAIEPKVFADIDVAKLGEEIAATVERSKLEDPEYLRRQIDQLRRQLADKKPEPGQVETKIERVEVPMITDEQLKALADHLEDVEGIAKELSEWRGDIAGLLNGKIESLNSTALQLSAAISEAKKPAHQIPKPAYRNDQLIGESAITSAVREIKSAEKFPTSESSSVTVAQQRILDAIAWLESVGLYDPKRVVVASLAGRSVKSSQWGTDLSDLRKNGLIDYPNGDSLAFTDLGRSAAHQQPAPLTKEELQRAVLSRLPRAKAHILEILIDKYPDPMNRDELARQAGRSIKSSQWGTDLSDLRSLGVIDYPSSTTAVALPILFLE